MAKPRPSVERQPDYETIRNDAAMFPLSDEEKGDRGLRLAEINTEVTNLLLERRATTHRLNEKIKEKRGAMDQLGEEIREGVSKTIRCKLKYYDKERLVARFDAETDEYLGEREMHDLDRQLLLDVRNRETQGKDKPAKKKEESPSEAAVRVAKGGKE